MTQEEYALATQQLRARLYRTAFLYLGSEALALDAVDEAVYKGLRGLRGLRQPEFFTTWLTRILLNECNREKKRQRRLEPLDTFAATRQRRALALLRLELCEKEGDA